MKKPVILLAVFAVISLAIWGGWRYQHRDDNDGTLTLYGNVDIRQISLAFDGSGRIRTLRAEEGDRVKAGEVLGVLDTRTLALQADQARAQIAVQQQTLLRLRHGSRPEEIALARHRLAAAEAQALLANKNLRRLQGLTDRTHGQAVSQQDLERARINARVARDQAAEQREALRLVEIGPREEDLAIAEAQLKAARAQLAVLQHQIDLGTLKAPAAAVVRSRLLEPGDMATPQRPAYTLALTQPKWVRVYVNETDLGRIRPGMPARVITDSHPDRPIDGRIGYISSVAEFTPKPVQTEELRTSLVYEVRVRVSDPDDLLRLGQPATVRLNLRPTP